MRILYNSTNHDVVCTDQDVEYTNHDVVYIFHGDNLEIDEIVIIFVYSKKNVFYLKIRTIVGSVRKPCGYVKSTLLVCII